MLTWGWKHEGERKAKTEREGKTERRLERADRCRSAGRRRLWWGVKNLSVWERRSKVNQGGRCGTYGTFWDAHHSTPEPQESRHNTTKPQCTMEMHSEAEHADKHKTPPSDCIGSFLLTRWTRQMRRALSISTNINFSKTGGSTTVMLNCDC